MKYFASIKQENDKWLVEFPDCSGCVTFGESFAQALDNAQEALEGWLESNLSCNKIPPLPRTNDGIAVEINEDLTNRILDSQLNWFS